MILITAKATVTLDNRQAYLTLCEAQVMNSRQETGCLEYGFYEDAMEPNSFVFVEKWQDQTALDYHFQQDYCLHFIKSIRKLAKATSSIEIHHISKTATPE